MYRCTILTVYYVVVLICALYAAVTDCEHTGGNTIKLTFLFRTAIILRKGNWRFVLRLKEGK